MRLPRSTEEWTGLHAEAAIDEAWKLFDRYDARVDFTWPRDRQDRLYRPYQLARERAVQVAGITNWCKGEANALP